MFKCGRIRTYVGVFQQIYNLSLLTTQPHIHFLYQAYRDFAMKKEVLYEILTKKKFLGN